MTEANLLYAPSEEEILADVDRALAEDIGQGDATASLVPETTAAHATLTCRDAAVLAGSAWFDACFHRLDPDTVIQWQLRDGDHIAADSVICQLQGRARALLSAERTALNFLQLLSGTATSTAQHVAKLQGTRTLLLDTRKTVPGLRMAQKYAVRCGGGRNQRSGLYDAMLIKENHIIAAGGIPAAVSAARARHPSLLLEVEVENLDELQLALGAGADRILLDNFSLSMMHEAVRMSGGRVPLETSGNVTLDELADIAGTGVDFVSMGALTKHVRAVDLSLRLHLELN